MERKTKGEYNF